MLSSCDRAPPEQWTECTDFTFRADLGVGEAYLCFGFDAAPLQGQGKALSSVTLEAPTEGVVLLHHVALYAVPGDYEDGPVPCETMPPDATELDVWAPGGEPLVLPDDVGLLLPEGTRRLVVQAHALRMEEGDAGSAVLRACSWGLAPPNLAAWLPLRAPTPAIRPHQVETSTATCLFEDPLHVFSTWPHMHRIGTEFHGSVVRADGTRETLIDVAPWVFEDQRAFGVDLDLAAGDTVETTCVWENPTDEYVLPGPRTTDEMCGQSLIVWPAQAARCAPSGGSS